MAGDWIKMRTSLVRDGRVREVARKLNERRVSVTLRSDENATPVTQKTEKCHAPKRHISAHVAQVLGALYIFWSIADELAVETEDGDGFLRGYTATEIDAEVGIEGFAESLPACWVRLTDEGAYLPQYQAHNGSTAKKRATDQRRQKQRRGGEANTPNLSPKSASKNVTLGSDEKATKTRLEKRREEKRRERERENVSPPSGDTDVAPVGGKKTTSSTGPPEYPARFLDFWWAYPPQRRRDKPGTLRQWRAVIRQSLDPDQAAMDLIDAAKRYAESPEGRSRFVVMPSKWLRRRDWETPETWQHSGDENNRSPARIKAPPGKYDHLDGSDQ